MAKPDLHGRVNPVKKQVRCEGAPAKELPNAQILAIAKKMHEVKKDVPGFVQWEKLKESEQNEYVLQAKIVLGSV